jgi:hypothetical protein
MQIEKLNRSYHFVTLDMAIYDFDFENILLVSFFHLVHVIPVWSKLFCSQGQKQKIRFEKLSYQLICPRMI